MWKFHLVQFALFGCVLNKFPNLLWMLSEKSKNFDEKSNLNQSKPNQSKPNQSKPNQRNRNCLKSPRAPWRYFWVAKVLSCASFCCFVGGWQHPVLFLFYLLEIAARTLKALYSADLRWIFFWSFDVYTQHRLVAWIWRANYSASTKRCIVGRCCDNKQHGGYVASHKSRSDIFFLLPPEVS